jgi:hypothetical protein
MAFCALPGQGSLIDLQREMAMEIALAEGAVTSAASREVLARHKRLIRIVGDSLALSLLSEHIIRTLARSPGPAAGVHDQGEDFAFVLDVAARLAASGYLPFLSDLTNLVKVGDIVAVSRDHVLVIECKRSPLPKRLPRTGRLARQRTRGTYAAAYLQESQLDEADGTQRQAVASTLPEPRWQVVTELASNLSPGLSGTAFAALGEGDGLILMTAGANLEETLQAMRKTMPGDAPVFGFHLDVVREPRWNCPSPLTNPVPAWLRHALLEGDALMFRMVELERLAGSETDESGQQREIRVTWSTTGPVLSLSIDDEVLELGPRFLDQLMYTPTALADMREALLSQAGVPHVANAPTAREAVGDHVHIGPVGGDLTDPAQHAAGPVLLAEGDEVRYGTVYTGPDREPLIVYAIPAPGDDPERHIVWSPIRGRAVALYVNGDRLDLRADDARGDQDDD